MRTKLFIVNKLGIKSVFNNLRPSIIRLGLLLVILSLAACAGSPPKIPRSEFVPGNLSVKAKNPGSVQVVVNVSSKPKLADPSGGAVQLPGTARSWLQILDNKDIAAAVSDTVSNTGLFASVSQTPPSDYILNILIVGLVFENKVGWTDAEAKILSNWKVIRTADSEILADYEITSRNKATFSEIFNGHERYRVAVARTIKQTIQNGIEELPKQDIFMKRMAVQREIDQTQLDKIAIDETNAVVRRDAVMKLRNQTLLAKIAVEDKSLNCRMAALRMITDQALLVKIADESKEFDILAAVSERLTDQSSLAKVQANIERMMWSKAEEKGNDADLYRAYFKRFPNALHRNEAKDCIDWAIAEQNGYKGIRAYLDKHPQGRFASRGGRILESANLVDSSLTSQLNDKACDIVKLSLGSSYTGQASTIRGWTSTGKTFLFYRGILKEGGQTKVLLDDNSRIDMSGKIYEYREGNWFPAYDRFFITAGKIKK